MIWTQFFKCPIVKWSKKLLLKRVNFYYKNKNYSKGYKHRGELHMVIFNILVNTTNK